MPYVSEYSKTSTSITVRIRGLDTTYDDKQRTIYWYVDGDLYDTQSLNSGVANSSLFTISGLEPNTTYEISAEIKYWHADITYETTYDFKETSGTTTSYINSTFNYLYDGFYVSDSGSFVMQSRFAVTWEEGTGGLITEQSSDIGYVKYNGYVYQITLQRKTSDGGSAKWAYRYEIVEVEGEPVDRGEWRYAEATSADVTTEKDARPDYFYWTYTKTKGGAFNLTATEWNSFTANINEVRTYMGLSTRTFTTAVKGNNFTAAMYNQARTAINSIAGAGTVPAQVYTGDIITADHMNDIVDAINAVE